MRVNKTPLAFSLALGSLLFSLGARAANTWPSQKDFRASMQHPRTAFLDPDLRSGEVALKKGTKQPLVFSGNYANVYRIKAQNGTWAVRVFTNPSPERQARYQAISDFLSEGRPEEVAPFEYVRQGIQVRGVYYPIIKIPWIEGDELNKAVGQLLAAKDQQGLSDLSERWRRLGQNLRARGMAHGDLQHGNVLRLPSKDLRLIDLDTAFIPAFAGQKSPEVGLPAYQHPKRTNDFYSGELDNFSLLAIYLSIKALRADPSLWGRFNHADQLILDKKDLQDPDHSAIFAALARSSSVEVRALTEKLRAYAKGPVEQVPDLESVLAAGAPAPALVVPPPLVVASSLPTPAVAAPTDAPVPADRRPADANWWRGRAATPATSTAWTDALKPPDGNWLAKVKPAREAPPPPATRPPDPSWALKAAAQRPAAPVVAPLPALPTLGTRPPNTSWLAKAAAQRQAKPPPPARPTVPVPGTRPPDLGWLKRRLVTNSAPSTDPSATPADNILAAVRDLAEKLTRLAGGGKP